MTARPPRALSSFTSAPPTPTPAAAPVPPPSTLQPPVPAPPTRAANPPPAQVGQAAAAPDALGAQQAEAHGARVRRVGAGAGRAGDLGAGRARETAGLGAEGRRGAVRVACGGGNGAAAGGDVVVVREVEDAHGDRFLWSNGGEGGFQLCVGESVEGGGGTEHICLGKQRGSYDSCFCLSCVQDEAGDRSSTDEAGRTEAKSFMLKKMSAARTEVRVRSTLDWEPAAKDAHHSPYTKTIFSYLNGKRRMTQVPQVS